MSNFAIAHSVRLHEPIARAMRAEVILIVSSTGGGEIPTKTCEGIDVTPVTTGAPQSDARRG